MSGGVVQDVAAQTVQGGMGRFFPALLRGAIAERGKVMAEVRLQVA